MNKLLKFYLDGFMLTIPIIVAFFIFANIKPIFDSGQNLLILFIPQQYLFPGSSFLFIFVLTPLILKCVIRGKIKTITGNIVNKIPILNIFWGNKKMPSGLETAIPVGVKFGGGIHYGFLMGKSIIQDDTNFIQSKTMFSVFLPSVPVIPTGWPLDFEPKNVREIEIVGKEGRTQARWAIINKSISFGQSIGKKVRFKHLKKSDIEKMSIIPKK